MMTEEQAKAEICSWIDDGICFDAQDMDQWLYDLTHPRDTSVSSALYVNCEGRTSGGLE